MEGCTEPQEHSPFIIVQVNSFDMMTQGTHHVMANGELVVKELPRCEKASCKIALFPKPGTEATYIYTLIHFIYKTKIMIWVTWTHSLRSPDLMYTN